MQELLDRFSALSAVELDGEAKRLNRCRAGAEWELAACLQAMEVDERYRVLGYKSVLRYAEGELGLSHRKAIQLLRVARMARDFPSVSEAFSKGEVSFCKLREIIRAIDESTAERWVEYARTHTTRQVERAVALSPRAFRKQAAGSGSRDSGATGQTENDLPQQEGLPFVEDASANTDSGSNAEVPANGTDCAAGGSSAALGGGEVGEPAGCLDETTADSVTKPPTGSSNDSAKLHAAASSRPSPSPTGDSQANSAPAGGTQGGSPKAQGALTGSGAPPPGPALVRLTFTLTAEQYAIYHAAEKRVKSSLRKRATREEVLTQIAKQTLATGNSRTRARYPVVVQTEDGQAHYPTAMGDLPADMERLRRVISEQPAMVEAALATPKSSQGRETKAAAKTKTSPAKAATQRTARKASRKGQVQLQEKSADKGVEDGQSDSAPADKPKVDASSAAKRTTIARKRRQVPTQVLRAVMSRARWQCEDCGSRELLELDHKTAVIDGGDNSADNLCVKCRHCHRGRHAADFLSDPRYLLGLDYAEARKEARLEAEEEARLLSC